MNGSRIISRENLFRIGPIVVSFALSLAFGYSIGFLGEFLYFFALVGGVVLFVLTVENRTNVMFLYVALIPLSENLYIQANLFGIQGMKAFNLLGAFLLALTLIKPARQSEAERRADLIFTRYFFVYLLIFVVAVLRAIPYIPTLHLALPATFSLSKLGFLMSHLIRQSLYLAPMLYIVYNIVTKKELEKTIFIICFSILLLSVAIISLFFGFRLWSSPDWHRHILMKYLGFHYNFLATHFIIMAPILFQKALTKKTFYVVTFVLAVMAVACLQSRTAYAIFMFAITFMLWFTGRRKIFPIIGLLLLMVGPYLIPAWVVDRALYGFSAGNINDISADRLDNIWIPLIIERMENLPALLFGLGRFSMVLSKVHLQGSIIQAYGAHNAFLEMALDSGLIVALAFVFFLFRMGKKLFIQAKARNDDFFWAIICSYICFLLSCMTDRVFYPSYSSVFIFIITGILIVYIRQYPVEIKEKKPLAAKFVNPVFTSRRRKKN